MSLMPKPSPLNARCLKLMRDSECRIYLSEPFGTPEIGEYGTDAYTIGRGIKLQRRNVQKMLGEGWIEIVLKPDDRWKRTEYGITETGKDILNYMGEADFKPSTIKPYFTAHEIASILRDWHLSNGGWLFLTEVQFDQRRLDAYALGMWGSRSFHSIGYEIKVNRGDLMADFKNPAKRGPALRRCHRFYYVTTKGLAHHTEFPPEVGLIEIWKDKSRHVIVDAPINQTVQPSWRFVGIVARLAGEQYHRRYDWNSGGFIGECRPQDIPSEEEPNEATGLE